MKRIFAAFACLLVLGGCSTQTGTPAETSSQSVSPSSAQTVEPSSTVPQDPPSTEAQAEVTTEAPETPEAPASETPQAPAPEAPADDVAALKAAVTAYSDAYLGGDGETAWSLQSQRCQDQIAKADMIAMADAANLLYGPAPISEIAVTIKDRKGLVIYTYYSAPDLNQTDQAWAKDGAAWKWDGC